VAADSRSAGMVKLHLVPSEAVSSSAPPFGPISELVEISSVVCEQLTARLQRMAMSAKMRMHDGMNRDLVASLIAYPPYP
jgi:hypothetical protein